MPTTTVRLQPEIEKELQSMAENMRRSKSWIINEALGDYISHRQAAQSRWQETLEAMESVAQGQVVSGDKVHAWLDTWGTKGETQPPRIDD